MYVFVRTIYNRIYIIYYITSYISLMYIKIYYKYLCVLIIQISMHIYFIWTEIFYILILIYIKYIWIHIYLYVNVYKDNDIHSYKFIIYTYTCIWMYIKFNRVHTNVYIRQICNPLRRFFNIFKRRVIVIRSYTNGKTWSFVKHEICTSINGLYIHL